MKTLILSLLLSATALVPAGAQVIVGFNNGTNALTGASTLDSGLDSAVMAFGAGLIKTETAADDFLVGGDPVGSNWDLQTALDNDYFYSISITPDSGQTIDFDSASFATFSQNETRTFYLFSDLTGFTTADALGSFEQTSTTTSAAGTINPISLAGAGLDSVSSSIEFRVYFTNQVTASTFEDSGFRQPSADANFVEFTGTVVPEPSALVLVAGGLGVVLMLRRRRA